MSHNSNVVRWRGVVFVLLILPLGFEQKPKLKAKYEWSQLEFDFESEKERKEAIDKGEFIPENSAPIDADVYKSGGRSRYFVTIPRFMKGIPASLCVVGDKKLNGNPVLKPYPSWEWHQNLKKCKKKRLVSVFRTTIDECHRMWVVDSGVIEDKLTCPPQILAFDLRKNKVVHRFQIPSSLLEASSLLVTPVVDVVDSNGKCLDTFLYIADCLTNSIIVYDVRKKKAWRLQDDSMQPDPEFFNYTILGDSFQLMDGVLGMALSPSKKGARKLFFHAMSSATENWIDASDLRNERKIKNSKGSSSNKLIHTYEGRRDSQSGPEAMTKDGIMFFGLMSNVTLNCWNSRTEYGPENMGTVADDQDTLQFISGLKVSKSMGREEITVFSSRFQKIAAGTFSNTETNFRILNGGVGDLLSGTNCARG